MWDGRATSGGSGDPTCSATWLVVALGLSAVSAPSHTRHSDVPNDQANLVDGDGDEDEDNRSRRRRHCCCTPHHLTSQLVDTMPAQQEAPLAVRVGPMDAAHRLDWDILDLGYPQVSQSTVHMIDMDLHIFGLEEIAGGTRPVGVIVGTTFQQRVTGCGTDGLAFSCSHTAGRTRRATCGPWRRG